MIQSRDFFKICEAIAVLVVIVSLILQSFKVPYSQTLLGIGLSILSMIYYIIGFDRKDSSEKKGTLSQYLNAIFGVSLSISIIGIMFKMLEWQYSDAIIGISIFALSVSFLICSILIGTKKLPSVNSKYFIARILALLIITIIISQIPSKVLLEYRFDGDEKAVRLYLECKNGNETACDSLNQHLLIIRSNPPVPPPD